LRMMKVYVSDIRLHRCDDTTGHVDSKGLLWAAQGALELGDARDQDGTFMLHFLATSGAATKTRPQNPLQNPPQYPTQNPTLNWTQDQQQQVLAFRGRVLPGVLPQQFIAFPFFPEAVSSLPRINIQTCAVKFSLPPRTVNGVAAGGGLADVSEGRFVNLVESFGRRVESPRQRFHRLCVELYADNSKDELLTWARQLGLAVAGKPKPDVCEALAAELLYRGEIE